MKFKNYLYCAPYEENYQFKVIKGITKKDLEDQLKNSWEPKDNDILYIAPGCNIPRFKLREKFKLTIKPESATTAFINLEQKKDTDFFNVYSVTKVDGKFFAEWFAARTSNNHKVPLVRSLMENYGDVYVDTNMIWYMKWDLPKGGDMSIYDYHKVKYYKEMYTKDLPTGHIFSPPVNSKLHALNCNIYSEKEVHKILNEDSLILNEDKFYEFKNMIDTGDQDNVLLTMELMANCDYEKSLVYLLILCRLYGHTFYQLKQSNHVNFKALLSYLSISKKQLKWVNKWSKQNSLVFDKIVTILEEKNQLTRTNVAFISQFYVGSDKNSLPAGFLQGPVLMDKQLIKT